MYDYILFDLDGTLTDPAEGITNSFKHALIYFGIEIPSYEKLCTYIGPPLPYTFKNEYGFDDKKASLGVTKYREYFAEKGLFENKVYDGIPELLTELKKRGKHLLVATSKPELYSIRILDYFGLSKYFDHICGCNMDETRSTKSEVIEYALELANISEEQKKSILMVGDRMHDIIGAKENNLDSCGVLFGYGSEKELQEAGANYLIKNPQDLLSIV